MMPHRSTLVLVTCITCLSFAPSLGRGINLYEPASASSRVDSATSLKVAQAQPSASDPPGVLDRGSQGTAVTDLQTKLKQLGFYDEKVDGAYGESTAVAVSKFQKSAGLKADGIAGPTTWERIQAAKVETKPATPTPRPKKRARTPFVQMNLWLISTFAIAILGVGVGLFLVLRWFGSATEQGELDPEEEADFEKDSSALDSKNGRSNGLAAAQDMPPLDTTSNGYAGTQPAPATDSESSFSPFPSNLLPSSGLSSSSSSESATGTPTEGAALEKTTRLPKINIVDELIKDLYSSDSAKRRKAIWELAQRGDSRAIQPLVDLIVDSDSQQRGLILEAVSQIGVRTLKPMNRALALSLQDENAQVRKNAIRDLTRVYEMITQINYLLRHALDDPDTEVQATGKWALDQLNRIRSTSGINNFSDQPPEDLGE